MTPTTSPSRRTVKCADQLAVVRARAACAMPSKVELVAADRDHRLPGLSAAMRSAPQLRLADDAEQRDAEAEMRERGAPGRARQAGGARAHGGHSGTRQQTGALDEIGHRAGHHEERQARCRTAPAPARRRVDGEDHRDRDERRSPTPPISRCATPSRSPRFQASSGPNGTAISSGTNSGPKVAVEERRADRNLLAGQRFERQRIERADEDGRAGGRQEQVVEHQRAFARDRREQAALLQQRRAPGEQREARRR